MTALRLRRLSHAGDLPAPGYASDGAAGLDLAAAIDAPQTLPPGGRAAIPTGFAIEIPPGFEGQVRARSGRARSEGLAVLNAPGTIDCDYRGEIIVLLVNHGDAPVRIAPGDRIAQLVVAPVIRVDVIETETLSTSARGAAGFGSTGRHRPADFGSTGRHRPVGAERDLS